MNRLPTVIVPIHNALEALDACLASLDRTLPAGTTVLLADDASTEEGVVFAAAGAVVELVWQDDMAGGVLFLERAAGGDGDDEAYAE